MLRSTVVKLSENLLIILFCTFTPAGLSIDKIKLRILSLQVYDFDRFSRNDPIGDVFFPLTDIGLNVETVHSMDLQEATGSVSPFVSTRRAGVISRARLDGSVNKSKNALTKSFII